MLNRYKTHSITIALLTLLSIGVYLSYVNLKIYLNSFESLYTLGFSFFVVAISIFALYIHFQRYRQAAMLKDLAVYISSISTTSNKKIQSYKFNNDKMAYEYIKSNFNQLHQSESKIRTDYKILKTFLSSFAYEIRTPMNAIFGYTKLLKETGLNAEQKELVSIIDNSYTALDATLGKISSDLTKQKVKLETKEIPFNLIRAVETAVETFSVQADKKDIVLGLYIDPKIPHNLLGDAEKLSQVITHLIDNALAMSEEYTTIDIKLENIASTSKRADIKFSVINQHQELEDKAIEYLRKVFDDMEIVEESPIIGSSIKNLTISNRIINRMGGTLEVADNFNEGLSFFFSVSFKKDAEEVDRELNPIFKGLKIGLALPHKDIKRQVDYNLQTYVEYLGGKFVIYDYNELTNKKNTKLPDVMFVYHAYAKNKGELETFAGLKSKNVLITSGRLRSQIDIKEHVFSSVVYAPITMSKILRILSESKENTLHNGIERRSSGDIHILVVEDNIISQTIIANILKKMNINVTVANNGKEAYRLIKKSNYCLVFMDIYMPIMDGFETTQKILDYEKEKNKKHTPIIAFSADAKEIDKKRYLDAGMDDLIGKPVYTEEIKKIIQNYCLDTNIHKKI